MFRRLVLIAVLVSSTFCQTPVIGGTCKLGTADVQIGGKQTQFFLKCETTADSAQGEGVWVVKSRAAATAAAATSSSSAAAAAAAPSVVPVENTQPQQHPKARKPVSPNICEQDNGARENEACAVSATCLQAHNELPSSYLQCDQAGLRWIRKSCQDGFIFNFEQQTCIVPKRMSSLSRQQATGLVCTFSSCSNSNPCSVGTCNNGYCCSSNSNSAPAIIMASGSSNNCVGCQSAPQVIAIPTNTCPGGGYSVGGCSSGYCATGYTCVQNQCCPSYSSAPRISVYSCPSGGSAVGACINGRCASGYRCHNNGCCPQATTQNPFVCPDGTQAAGGCVNGQCGSGYTCSNGLCCAGTSTTVKCLDGSDAVGACIPSCQGDGCGGVQVSYYCGSGYTCTTGNICCPVNSCPNGGEPLGPTINGLCPTGYTVQGSLCCSATCSDGSTGTEPVNGVCPSGFTLENGVCCGSSITCSDEISIGPCTTGVNNGCPAGYACDMNGVNCCPVVDYQSDSCIIGTAVGGLCPPGYTVVYIPNSPLIENGVNPGTCVDVQCTTGICPATEQISDCDANTGACPSGYSCFENALVCCSTNTFSRLRVAKGRKSTSPKLNYGRPLNSYMPPKPTFGGSSSCSDGSISSGPCINGLCGIGLECQNGKCCQEGSTNRGLESKCPSGDTAVSGCFPNGSCGTGFECVAALNLCCPPGQPSTSSSGFGQLVGGGSGGGGGGVASVRPIGARCQFDSECVSHHEGLSMCHAGVCQCSPIAFSQGIACIRRKSFQMNDEPMKNDDNVAINDDTDDKKKSSANTIV